MGWCDDPRSISYNKQIKLPSKFSHEKLYRKDNKYDFIIPIKYNFNKKGVNWRCSLISLTCLE